MEYFVSFAHTSGRGDLAFAESIVNVGGPMTAEALPRLRAFLESQFPGEQIAIISFQRLG